MYSIFEIFLLCSILLFVIYGVVFTLSPRLKYPYIGVNVLYFFYIILVNAIFIEFNTAFLEYSLFNNLIVRSSDSNIFTSVIVFLAAIVSLITMSYNFKLLIPIFEFSLLNLIAVLNSSLIISSNNLFLFFLLIELQSMLLFILTAVNRRNRYSVEAGLKYFILGSFSSIMMLLGICLIYLSTSFMFIDDFITFSLISIEVCNRHIAIGCELGITLILISFFFKIYSAPFHFWVSDIYQGASIGSVLVFSTNSFLVLFYTFFKLYFNMFSMIVDFETLSTYVTVFGALSMVCGSIGGLVQRRIKRLVAYSSINVTGYLLLVIANGDVSSMSSMFVFIFTYIISIFGIFSILSNLLVKNKWYLDSYKQLTNFSICSR